jgi:hypothetical protein
VLVVEDLNLRGLAGGMLAKQVSDVACGQLIEILEAKAEEAGRELINSAELTKDEASRGQSVSLAAVSSERNVQFTIA